MRLGKEVTAFALGFALVAAVARWLPRGTASAPHIPAAAYEPLGLPGVDLGKWTGALVAGDERSSLPADAEDRIERALRSAPGKPAGMAGAFREIWESLGARYPDADSYFALASAILGARERIRESGPPELLRPALYLLGLLADETLYALTARFPAAPASWRWSPARGVASERCKYPASRFLGIDLCQGDIVLSKWNTVSSGVLLFRAPSASTYSHAALAYQDAGKGKLFLLQSDLLPNGLPAGPTEADEAGAPVKLAAYRVSPRSPAGDADLEGKAARSASRVAARMRSLGFNYGFAPDCGSDRYFCAELVYCAYRDAGMSGDLNPYPRERWSPTAPEAEEFIQRVLDVYWGPIPTPSDVELSAGYAPVAMVVQLGMLADSRIRLGAVSALIRLLHEDATLRAHYLAALESLGDVRLEQAVAGKATELADRLGIPLLAQLRSFQGRLPPGMKLRDFVFYYHFDQILVPEAVQAVSSVARDRPWIGLGEIEALARPVLARGIERFAQAVGS